MNIDSYYLPTEEEIMLMHQQLMVKYGGGSYFTDSSGGGVSSILSQFYYAGVKYKTIEQLAAYLLYLFVKGHVFTDGNKRTGTMAFLVFLDMNDKSVEFTNKELVNLTMFVAESHRADKDKVIKKVSEIVRKKLIA